jgi:hypothetical protein
MDSNEVAVQLGINARTLRQFLRSPVSTFAAVGSGARYDFTPRDVSTMRRRFEEWQRAGKPKATAVPAQRTASRPVPQLSPEQEQRRRDEAVWAEEGTLGVAIRLPDIKNPYVRKRVLQAEADRVARLDLLLLAARKHITQPGNTFTSRRKS